MKHKVFYFTGTGNSLNAGFSVLNPSNYLPFGEAVQGNAQAELLQTGAVKISRIAGIIKQAGTHFDKEAGWFRRNISPGLLYSLGYMFIHNLDKSFAVDENCSSCGLCAQVCPVDNVRLEEGKPVWHRKCQMCMGLP
ncbi:EFR1 family ferrodoxin [Marispirochaeta sp.]|uniref:EFR1 family ferrodoxin n=1 Tax=Marispirochaeta sp. TaxID=2038653 RepID=UPI0029C698F1|nr:EFR1 family ferrodoxin [Marispirochaeta sp.]